MALDHAPREPSSLETTTIYPGCSREGSPMDTEPTGRLALLSIHPGYAEAIFEGTKRVEFRRWRFGVDVSVVVVYATQPVGQIIGWFEVDGVDEGTPLSLWRRYSSCAGIDRASYLAYFENAS